MAELQIPIFSPADRYTFFNDLLRNSGYANIDLQKKALYRRAHSYYDSVFQSSTNTNGEPLDQIQSAIDFLGNAAANERNKEIHAIEYYLKDLYNNIPDSLKKDSNGKKRSFQKIIEQLKRTAQQITRGVSSNSKNDIDNFYIELTTYINMIRSNTEDFLARVHQIKNNHITERSQLASYATSYRVMGDIDQIFKSLSGTQSRSYDPQSEKESKSFANGIRMIITEYIKTHVDELYANVDLNQHFPAILAGIAADFEYFIQHERNLQKDYTSALDLIKNNELKSMFEKYITQSNTYFLQQFKKYIKGSNTKEFEQALIDFEDTVNIKYIKAGTQAEKQRKETLKKYEKTTLGKRNVIQHILSDSNDSRLNAAADMNKMLSWSIDTGKHSTFHGDMREAIQELVFGSFMVGRRGAATDNIYIGSIKATFDDEEFIKIRNEKISAMREAINNTVLQEREDRLQDYSDALKKEIDVLSNIEDDLSKELHELTGVKFDNIFVFHESLKLYSTVEISKDNKRRTTKFTGRHMQAFSALDNIFSMDDLGIINLPNKDALYGIVLNLANGAVASGMHNTIEDYLSIFAGLLLFSDIRDMAKELAYQAERGIEHSSPTKIHLYLLNDTYVPGSMILTYVYDTIRLGFQHISAKDGAQVTIDTAAASGIITKYISDRENGMPYGGIPDWEETANSIAANTKVQINFLSSYVTFIKNIANKFK